MNTPQFNEKQLLADIEQLRGQFTQTQDLYREVCILLFFRYGVTPTTNKLYQLVHKGSMSAPAEALARFWDDLRDKSRVRIEHPDLPESLKTAAGELVGALWSSAQEAAQASLDAFRHDAQAHVAAAKQAQTAAEAERESLRASHDLVNRTLERADARIGELEQTVAAAKATIAGLEGQLHAARIENASLLQKLEEARRDFAQELEKLRAASNLAEERFRSAETRALKEIDRERTVSAKLQKDLDLLRANIDQAASRHRSEVLALQEQLGDYRQKSGELEGNLKAVSASRDLAFEDLRSVRAALDERNSRMIRLESDAAELRQQLGQARQKIEILSRPAKPPRLRKTKTSEPAG